MMTKAILFTQCLQKDFVKPIGRYESLPNLLHIGYEESKRLLGEYPEAGPLHLTMKWAYQQSSSDLKIINIRDWHNPDDEFQRDHLRQFGSHCIANTEGAEFAFPHNNERETKVINSKGLNDFVETDLANYLNHFQSSNIRVGIIGVWTEAKVSFLAYDLKTRYPHLDIAVCSALTASSSRTRHFEALEQLERLLGVNVISSVGEFTQFLNHSSLSIELPMNKHANYPFIEFEGVETLQIEDKNLIRYLFRDCKTVHLRELSGGFSGNLVFRSESSDFHGHLQVPNVIKIGPQEDMGKERASFEKIENVLGNNAPRITAFADYQGRGALKYRYASMGKGQTHTIQQIIMGGADLDKIEKCLNTVFNEQLGRFYKAGSIESVNLLKYYWYRPEMAERVKTNIENVYGKAITKEDKLLSFNETIHCPNPYIFYKEKLNEILTLAQGSSYFSFVHGDLNGANIIIDEHENVWLIDFFHTHRGHILKDLIKFENDLLYIFTPVNNIDEFKEATKITDILMKVEDLAKPLPELSTSDFKFPQFFRTYQIIKMLRSFYPKLIQSDRNPLQLFIGILRYSAHTLIFDESNAWQRKWALYTSGWCSSEITNRIKERGRLRVDWLNKDLTLQGRMGLTLLPGRKDYQRDLKKDLEELKKENVDCIVPLITNDELNDYGVQDLIEQYQQSGFHVIRLPIMDQKTPSIKEAFQLIQELISLLNQKKCIVLHCVGGLGRAGLIAACFLVSQGITPQKSIKLVRETRSPRAIETAIQEKFIRLFCEFIE